MIDSIDVTWSRIRMVLKHNDNVRMMYYDEVELVFNRTLLIA